MLSQVQMAVLSAAITHVPENFLERNEIILNICLSFPPFLTLKSDTVVQLIVLTSCRSLLDFYRDHPQDIASTLWQASWNQKEPYLAFVNPPVSECVNCGETLHPYARVAVTLCSLSGPIPGQRGVLRCKSCKVYYHLDWYTVPNSGKSFYPPPITSEWKTASNRVFWMGTCKISYVYPGTCSVSVICHSMLVVHFENPSWHDSFLISLSDHDFMNFIKSSRLSMYLLLNISFEHSAQHI